MKSRLVTLATAVALLAAVAIGYTVHAAGRAERDVQAGPDHRLDLATAGQLVFRDTSSGPGFGHVAALPLTNLAAQRTVSGLRCDRIATAAGTGVCLTAEPGVVSGFATLLVDRHLVETRRITPPGVPNRARMAPNGRSVAWTAFVTGHSYAAAGFSTRTSILDLDSGKFYADIETLQIFRDGRRLRSPSLNLWGVTFTPDGRRFYASASSDGSTYLVEGDIASWEAQVRQENVECPSLSPDSRRIVFKKRVSSSADQPWQLYVLDLASGAQTPIPGTLGIDDQAAWLDGDTLMYAMNRAGGGSDIWAVAADGSAMPRLLVTDASSPSIT